MLVDNSKNYIACDTYLYNLYPYITYMYIYIYMHNYIYIMYMYDITIVLRALQINKRKSCGDAQKAQDRGGCMTPFSDKDTWRWLRMLHEILEAHVDPR